MILSDLNFGNINVVFHQIEQGHPRIPRGDSARYIDPWDN